MYNDYSKDFWSIYVLLVQHFYLLRISILALESLEIQITKVANYLQ